MFNEHLPARLYKANVQLQMDITRLLQESGHGWLDATRQAGAEESAQSLAQVDALVRAGDWKALMALPSEYFSRALQGQISGSGALTNTAIRSQLAFTNGLQQALMDWQQTVANAFGDSAEAASFVDVFKQWGRPWTNAPLRKSPKRK